PTRSPLCPYTTLFRSPRSENRHRESDCGSYPNPLRLEHSSCEPQWPCAKWARPNLSKNRRNDHRASAAYLLGRYHVPPRSAALRSEEHTSELQSRENL